MIVGMLITLACSCGNKQPADASGGQTVSCQACGQTLTVPAMGVLAEPKGQAKPTTPSLPQTRIRPWLVAAAAAMLLLIGVGWFTWWMTRETLTEPIEPIAQLPGPKAEPKPRPEVFVKPKQPSIQETPWPPLIETTPRDPYIELPKVIEPIKPKDTLPKVIEPIKSKDTPPSVIEPVKQVGELPNPFLMPFRPALDPPKIVEKKPNVMEPLRLVWKLKEGDAFYQELMVAQKPTFKVQGLAIASMLQYHIVSRFTVKKAHADGSLSVEQKIESAKLVLADDLTKPAVAGAIAKMPGTAYRIELSPTMDVTKLDGAVGNPKVGALDFGGAMGLQMTSLIDRDGWKELAQSTFFQMDKPLKLKDRWSKPMTHNWGALGTWNGQIHYLYLGKQENFHKVGYALQLAYKSPTAGAVGLLNVNGATFQPPFAEGMLLFDAVKGKVVAAEERFRVRGVVNINLLGQNTPIEIDEDQYFMIRIHDKALP